MSDSMFTGKTFDDFLLKPHYGIVNSRKDVDIQLDLVPGFGTRVPVMAANMDMLVGKELALALTQAGGIACMPYHITNRKELMYIQDRGQVALTLRARDIKDSDEYTVREASFVIIDMAHGHSVVMQRAIGEFKQRYPQKLLGAGNVGTPEGAADLMRWGADFVKVGIGPGSCCITRLQTGAGVPQLQAIWECSKVAPIVADGGIRNHKDIFLALACGARAIMCGGFFAHAREAVGKGTLRGMASREACPGDGAPPEGIQRPYLAPVTVTSASEPIRDIVANIAGYLRSSVSYAGCASLRDVQAAVAKAPHDYLIPLSEAAKVESFVR